MLAVRHSATATGTVGSSGSSMPTNPTNSSACFRCSSGKLRAVVGGYACHCTVLSGQEFSGDYAGFAQIAIEKAHPGATALFVAGCVADHNPVPRRAMELAEAYGNRLADSIEPVPY